MVNAHIASTWLFSLIRQCRQMVTFPLSVAQLITLVICVDREQGSEYGRQGQHAHPTHPTPPSSSPFYPGTQLPQHAQPTPPSSSPYYPGTQLPQHILTLLILLLLAYHPTIQVHIYHSIRTLLTLLLLAHHPSIQVHSFHSMLTLLLLAPHPSIQVHS